MGAEQGETPRSQTENRVNWRNLAKNVIEVGLYAGVGALSLPVVIEVTDRLLANTDFHPVVHIPAAAAGILYGLAFYFDLGTWRPVRSGVIYSAHGEGGNGDGALVG